MLLLIIAITSIVAWINTINILKEIRVIKKHLGIIDDKTVLLNDKKNWF